MFLSQFTTPSKILLESVILSNEEMVRLGGEEAGYERVRRPTPDPTDFSPAFDLHSDEHRAWLQAEGTI